MADALTFYGTKRVEAWPDERPSFNDVVGGMRLETADSRPGYAIRYPDGYTSWSPKDVFEATYHVETDMPFEGALAAMREGRKVRRLDVDVDGITIHLSPEDGVFYATRMRSGSDLVGRWFPMPEDLSTRRWTVVE
jgi:hypothetical protein